MKQVALTDFGTYFKTDITSLGTVEDQSCYSNSSALTVPDNKRILFGSDSDVGIQYDESTDDRLEISGGEVYVDNTLRAKRGVVTHTFTTSGASVTLTYNVSKLCRYSGMSLLCQTQQQKLWVNWIYRCY